MVILMDFPINGAFFGLVLSYIYIWTLMLNTIDLRVFAPNAMGFSSQYKVPASFFSLAGKITGEEAFIYGFTGRRPTGREFPAILPKRFFVNVPRPSKRFCRSFSKP